MTSGNQPIPAESFVSSADCLAVDIADEPHDSIPIAQAPSIRTVADELTAAVSSKEMQKIIADDLTDNTASFDNFKLDPDTWEDEGDEEVYYEPATTVKELEHRLQDLGNMHCVGLLRYLRIDWIRLRMRPKMANGCYLNVERASSFIGRLISHFGKIDHPVVRCIDKAWYVIKYLKGNVYLHCNTPAQTGRAVKPKEEALKIGELGSVEYFNPLYLLQHLTIDQLIYVGRMCLESKDMTNRKVKLLDRLGVLWKKGDKVARRMIHDSVGQAFTYLTIKSPLSVMFRAVSSQVLRHTKGSTQATDNLSFSVFITNPKPWDVYLLCGPLPERRNMESRVQHLESKPMIREETFIKYPDNLRVHVNGRLITTPLFDQIGGSLYPREIASYLRLDGWNTFLLTFDLDDRLFVKGFVLHLVHGYFKTGKESLHKS